MSGKRKAKPRIRTNTKKQKGLTLPGYNNLGPFNDLNTPLKKSDADALMHDVEYGKIGNRAYWTFTQADENLIEALKDEKDYGAIIAKNVFKTKKKLSEWKLLPSEPLQSKPKENPLLDFHKNTGNVPLTRARKKALEVQQQSAAKKITDFFKKQKDGKPRRDQYNVKQPLSNLQETTHMVEKGVEGGGGSNTTAGLKETPIDAVVDVERGFPSYQFASLPWSGTFYKDAELYTGVDFGFRMTSPYDVIIEGTYVDRNTNASAKAPDVEMVNSQVDSHTQSAMWYSWYKALYKYYHVVGCKWSILFENLSHEPMWIHQFYLNDSVPPYYASNDDMLNWPDCQSHYLESMAKYVDADGIKSTQLATGWQRETQGAATGTNFASGNAIQGKRNTLQLSGQYSPGDVNHDIRLDSDVENWTQTLTNPKLLERLAFRIKPETQAQRTEGEQGAVNYGRKLKYKYTVRLEYLVEFKELVDGLRWPTTYIPITPTIEAKGFETTKSNENEPSAP
jgi:hypothetical protein